MALFLDVVFGAIGSAYLLYGRRQTSGLFAVAGLLLIVFPYFVDGALLTLVAGGALLAAPFLIQRFG